MPKPELRCCRAFKAPFPSGWHWVHSRRCAEYPGQRVGEEQAHPAGLARSPRQVWEEHPPGHGCWQCLYVEHWLDRDDADGPVREGENA